MTVKCDLPVLEIRLNRALETTAAKAQNHGHDQRETATVNLASDVFMFKKLNNSFGATLCEGPAM